jgi:hypothetical protein
MNDNELKYGIEVLGFSTDYNFYNELNRYISQQENTTEFGAYFKYKFIAGDFVFEPSFRAHYYASLSNFSPEPRLGLKYNVTNRMRIKASAGLFSQNLIQANSDRDVVNLFYGFLSGSENLPSNFTQRNGERREVTHRLQKAQHAIFGVEFDITKDLTLNVEGFYKNFTQLTNINRNKIYDDTKENAQRPDNVKKDFIIEDGKAYGIDFVVKYDFKRLYLWGVYSLMKVDRWDGQILYAPVFDRRHNVNLVGAYTFGKKLDWEFSTRWNYGSGFPFTPTQGYFENITFADGINTNVATANGSIGFQPGELGSKRLPAYHRLDITLKKRFELSSRATLEATASITNLYNRENIFFFDRLAYERVNQLPLMPSAGLTLSF